MNILITGANGMVGTALVNVLKTIRDGKNGTRPHLTVGEIYEYTRSSTDGELAGYCAKADFVFHLAGVNRPKDPAEFTTGNVELTARLLQALRRCGNGCPIMLASSVQASLCGRFGDSAYGRSKLACEELLFSYGAETGAKTAVYRFPNLMGHSKPNYNSAVSTFCYNTAHDLPITLHDRREKLELLYIDDLAEAMLDLLEGRERRCEYDGSTPVDDPKGRYCYVPTTHCVTLGEVADLLAAFRAQPVTLLMPRMPNGSFAQKLFSLYLSYLPEEKAKYALTMHRDDRGSFTELIRTRDCGQVSVNITRPGVTRGQHWHRTKWEQFMVVRGRALIRERNIDTGEIMEFEVGGDRIESVYMLPGWTHSITNLSETEDLVTIMTSSEVFDPDRPDTYFEPV